jgi:4'-phosphopantetheinyl transferase
LRAILAKYLNRVPQSVSFTYGPRGKPALAENWSNDRITFNLSHSEGLALCAVTRAREVGIDIEYTGRRTEVERDAERFFSPSEVHTLRALPSDLRRHAFFLCWTRKEAYIKAKGEGLALPLAQFAVSLTPGEPAALLSTDWDPNEATRWSMQELTPAPDYAAAIAVEGHGWSLSCWEWSLPE